MPKTVKNPVCLPAVTFEPADVKNLQKKLEKELHLSNISVTVTREGTSHTYESLDSMISDTLSPHVIRTFEIRFDSAGGSGRITADSKESDEHLLYIDGYYEWCEYIRTKVVRFMDKRSRILRSKLSNKYLMTAVSAISTILVGQMFTTLSPFGVFYPSPDDVPTIQIYLLIFSITFFSSTFRQYFFPYAYLKTTTGKSINLYKKSVIKIVLISLFLIVAVEIINVVAGGSVSF